MRGERARCSPMRRSPPKLTVEEIPRPILPEPNAGYRSPALPMVVQAWCIGVERMSRRTLDRFTRDIWARDIDARDSHRVARLVLSEKRRNAPPNTRGVIASGSACVAFVHPC